MHQVINSNPISNDKPVHRQEQAGGGGGDWNLTEVFMAAHFTSSLQVELRSTFSCWKRKCRDLSSVCCSGLRCRSSRLSAHLKWMTTAQCVSLCQRSCECLVTGVVTVAAEVGPLKRFFQLWSPAWSVCWKQRVLETGCLALFCSARCSASGSGWLALSAQQLNGIHSLPPKKTSI